MEEQLSRLESLTARAAELCSRVDSARRTAPAPADGRPPNADSGSPTSGNAAGRPLLEGSAGERIEAARSALRAATAPRRRQGSAR